MKNMKKTIASLSRLSRGEQVRNSWTADRLLGVEDDEAGIAQSGLLPQFRVKTKQV